MYIGAWRVVATMSFATRLGPYVWRDIHLITYFDRGAVGLRRCVEEGYPCHTCRPNFSKNAKCVEKCNDAWEWWYGLHNVVNRMKGKARVDRDAVCDLQAYCDGEWDMVAMRGYVDALRERCVVDGSWYPGFIHRMKEWGDYVR